MITKVVEGWRFVQNANANDWLVLCACDNCKGEFMFAAFKSEKDGPRFLAGEFYQFELVKFCPYCGARNTKPRPVAHRD